MRASGGQLLEQPSLPPKILGYADQLFASVPRREKSPPACGHIGLEKPRQNTTSMHHSGIFRLKSVAASCQLTQRLKPFFSPPGEYFSTGGPYDAAMVYADKQPLG